MSPEEKGIQYKLSEATKDIILGNAKTPHKSVTHVNFNDFNLGDLIKTSYHQFYFGNTNNEPSNIDTTGNNDSTDGSINDSTIITKRSKRDK